MAALPSTSACITRVIGGAACTAVPPMPGVYLVNRAVGLGVTEAATGHALDAIDAFYAGLGLRYAISLSPVTDPPDLAARLRERGFTPGYAWAKFSRGAEPYEPRPSELRVERVATGAAADFAGVVSRGYGMPAEVEPWLAAVVEVPGFACYVAYDGRVPAGAGAFFASAGAAWLGFAATLPEFRGRGAQNALLAARIRDAAALGVTTFVTETGERLPDRPSNSYRNIERSGFELQYVRPNLVSPPH